MNKVTYQRLREVLNYDPDTGVFTWRVRTGRRVWVGDVAGCLDKHSGYYLIGLDRRVYTGHLLAWLYVTGEWPAEEVDHKNRDRADNRWENLRAATHKQNMENRPVQVNSTSRARGVTWITAKGLWRAQIQHERRFVHLGYHDNLLDAMASRLRAERQLFTHIARP